ncbi:MAG: nucleotidyltransferase domain-containing protein [bacterium]|nr:nucleotidyltransferase domain-containing protein [bacterium]MCM1374296.1 nucleotidyltransferase domain-containing protein [Muribaculum sp.]
MPTSEIRELTNLFVEQLLPVRIYLFGSFADSTYTEESNFDFYIIVQGAVSDILAETTKAYKSIRKVKQRPVDIVVETVSRFEARKEGGCQWRLFANILMQAV